MAFRGLSALPVGRVTPCAPNRRFLYLAPEFELLAFFSKMREVRAAPARHVRLADLIRAVAQLGRAPGSGQYSDCFLKLSRLDLTCSTLDKSPKLLYLICAHNMPKFFHRWIKRWIKAARLTVADQAAASVLSLCARPLNVSLAATAE